MNKKIRPIVKWTGGKYSEFTFFNNQIPQYNRYIEPFFGGGGVFFALQPTVQSFINDKSTDLFNFYNQIGNKQFEMELFKYADAWDEVQIINDYLWDKCGNDFMLYLAEITTFDFFKELITKVLPSVFKKTILFNQVDFLIDMLSFNKILLASILDKTKRIKRIINKENRLFANDELKIHFETGIRSGVYLFFRSLLNHHFNQKIKLNPQKAAANWYFIREFCYASMFRFNNKGEFNIPYGGIAYNTKNFRQKVCNIFDKSITNLFKQTKIFNLDFEVFLNQINLQSTDFIFLDPPYDSEFSEYDQNSFTQADQQRLASYLIKVPAKWMVIIKETAFIRNIYTHKNVNITTFNKNYTYNVRGRNNRAVTHLIITNY